jgi:hypothetical protein
MVKKNKKFFEEKNGSRNLKKKGGVIP